MFETTYTELTLYFLKYLHSETDDESLHCIIFCIVFVFILRAISPCTTGLKTLYDPSDCTSTVQLSNN